MEKDLDWLVEYFDRYISELETELSSDPDDEFLKGKIKGMKHALDMTRMYNIDEKGRHQIDLIIETPIMQKTSKEYDSLLEKIMEMDPMIRKANDKLMKLSSDPEFVDQVKHHELQKNSQTGQGAMVDAKENGTYKVYKDKDGNKVHEFPDGRKEIVDSKTAEEKFVFKDENGNTLNVYADRLEFNSQTASKKLRNDLKKTNELIKGKFREAIRRPE